MFEHVPVLAQRPAEAILLSVRVLATGYEPRPILLERTASVDFSVLLAVEQSLVLGGMLR